MSLGQPAVTVQCLSFRDYFSASNMKSALRGFVYEYETPKIVTIHSISSKTIYQGKNMNISNDLFILVALMCRLIQVLILIYGIVYLMIHKKGYQETNTSIISSITLKVKVKDKKINKIKVVFVFLQKGIGYNQTEGNQTLVIDGAGK
jgi:hypothetical protein